MAISKARHRANEKYNAKAYDEIKVRVPKGQKEVIQEAAGAINESVNAFINKAIMNRVNSTSSEGYRVMKRLAAMTEEERDRAYGITPEKLEKMKKQGG